MVVAVVVLGLIVWGSLGGTDDAWPFAPFRMFARATKVDGVITHPEFVAVHADGTTRRVFSTDFHLRRAEVEAFLTRGRGLPNRQLDGLAATYQRDNPEVELVELRVLEVGQRLAGGVPVEEIERVVQTWRRR
jgi:hypothetical protein